MSSKSELSDYFKIKDKFNFHTLCGPKESVSLKRKRFLQWSSIRNCHRRRNTQQKGIAIMNSAAQNDSRSILTQEQTVILEKFRLEFSGISDATGLPIDDNTLIRYLKARKWDIEKSKALLNSTIEWRKNFGLDQIESTWKPIIETENATGKLYVRGFDKEGHAICYMKPRHENSKNHDGNVKHLVYNMERAVIAMKEKTGKEKVILLIDYKGFSLFNSPPMKTSMEILHILQDHYPERLKRAYLINPPMIFSSFWKVISPFVDPVTKDKIVFLKGAEVPRKLAEHCDLDVIESCLHGSDERPFDSGKYLSSAFHMEFHGILENEINMSSGISDEKDIAVEISDSTATVSVTDD